MFNWLRKWFASSEGDRPRAPEQVEPWRSEGPAVPIQPRQSMLARQGQGGRAPEPKSPSAKKQNPYPALRKQALTSPREEADANPRGSTQPWAAIMEMGVEGATMTIAAFEDGTASIYLSSGRDFIGGGGEEKIRAAGKAFITAAEKYISQMILTDAFPEPRLGETIFYVRTDVGTFTAKEPKEELVEGRNMLSPLFAAAQEVITQYRLRDEARGK
jgi:hypothetical protein